MLNPTKHHIVAQHLPPPSPGNSYAKVLNEYSPYAYCSLDKAVPSAYHIHGELVRERGKYCTNVPKIRAMWVQVGKHSQMCP